MISDPFAPGLLARLPHVPRKVAVVRPSRIGDFVCAVPAFRALRAALPQAEIVVVTLPLLRQLAERLPYFDRFVAFPGYPGLAEQFFDARCTLRFFEQMQAEHFDLVLQLQGSGVNSNPFALMFGAQATAGFVRQGDGAGRMDAALPIPCAGHEVQRVLALPLFLGAEPQGAHTEFPLREEDHAEALALLGGVPPPLLGLHPGARSPTRRWFLERFALTGAELRRQHGGTLVVIGGPEDRAQGKRLAEWIGRPVLNLCGATASLPVLGAVIARLALLITNDSGPAHIAYALGTPTVTIFGGEDPQRYGPPMAGPFRVLVPEVQCRPCGEVVCPIGYECLRDVTVGQVMSAAIELMV